jgi:outer membrane immunogenic protein
MGKVAFAAAFAACFVVSGAASAADLSLKDTPEVYVPAVAPIWTGFYGGIHIGGGWGDGDVTDVFDYNGDPRADNTIEASGLIAGVQLGYNVQRGNFVFGVEADLGYLNLDGSTSAELPKARDVPENELHAKYSLEGGLYGDLTARVGYATGRTLLYAKGGAAFLNAKMNADYVGANCTTTYGCFGKNQPRVANPSEFSFESDETLFGWTFGVGVEYALTPSLSLKLEYQHFDFGSMANSYGATDTFACKYNGGSCTSTLTGKTETDVTVDAVKLGLNYQFNRGEEALK